MCIELGNKAYIISTECSNLFTAQQLIDSMEQTLSCSSLTSMDSLTHALVGALIGELSPKRIKNRQTKGALAAMAPDMANFFADPYLGIKSGNTIPYAYLQDFYSNPWIVDHWTWIPWEISHSFFF